MFTMMTAAVLALAQPAGIDPGRVAALERRVAELEARLAVAGQHTPAPPAPAARLYAAAAECEAYSSTAAVVSYQATAAGGCASGACSAGVEGEGRRVGPVRAILGRFRR